MAAKSSFANDDKSYFRTYFVKLVIFALLPILLLIVSYIFWFIQWCI